MPGGGFRSTGFAVRVTGLRELQRAFKKVGADLPKNTKRALREIAVPVRAMAIANIQHKTGRHGEEVKHLAETIKISSTQRALALSVYSNHPYSAAQDVGARVGVGWDTHNPKGYHLIPRATASHYMTKAVDESRPATERALENLGNKIANEFERG